VGERRGREVLGQVPLQDRPGHRLPHPGGGRPHRRRGRRLPPCATCSRRSAGRPPELDAEHADHAVRRRRDLPVQPLRPHQGVAARRLPADRGRPADAGPQPDRLPHRDRAGGLRAEQPRARHRVSPDKMLLARVFSYADAHRARSGSTTSRSRSTRPKAPVHSYSKDGAMRVQNVSDPVYAPNSKGGPQADGERYPEVETWEPAASWSTPPTRCARTTTTSARPAPWCARSWTTPQRDRLVANVVGHLSDGVSEPCCSGPSSTGATSTRRSATASPRAYRRQAPE
jgi:hypothetical protein